MNQKELDKIYHALIGNGLNSSVASFLTDLAGRVKNIESSLENTKRTFSAEESGYPVMHKEDPPWSETEPRAEGASLVRSPKVNPSSER